jgi:hypothetical protein
MFPHITQKRRGKPLISREVIIQARRPYDDQNRIEDPRGSRPLPLPVLRRDRGGGPRRSKLETHRFHGDWNYAIFPAREKTSPGYCDAAT